MQNSIQKKNIFFKNVNLGVIIMFQITKKCNKKIAKTKFLLFIIFIIFFIKIKFSKISYIPKITIYLPIYNKQKYIIKSIRSIQNQTLKDIEIIAVNDYSTDNSLKILKKLLKKDSRIKIINNDNNHGALYTRAMGILNSSGEFVMNLDPDDNLKRNNSLQHVYKIAHKNNLDVVTFSFLFNNKNILKCSNKNKILKQPLLFESAYKNNLINDWTIWNKLVKRQLMLKIYKIFKKNIYKNKWNYNEDTIWSILINKYAESKICIDKAIYIYNLHKDSQTNNDPYIRDLNNLIYYVKMHFKIFTNEIEYKYILYFSLIFFLIIIIFL